MPHNLFDGRMAFVGKPAWHGLGAEVDSKVSAQEMIRAAGLDWKVWVKPAPGAEVDVITGKCDRNLVMRGPLGNESEEVALGWVGPRYQPLQNSIAFRFFEPFLEEGWANFETAGALGRGEVIWVLARLDGSITVGDSDDSDKIKRYLLLCNSHDGSSAVTVRFTAIRVVCENTLILAQNKAFSSAMNSILHTRSVVRKLRAEQASKLKEITENAFSKVNDLFNEMAEFKMDEKSTERYLHGLFPRTKDQKRKDSEPLRWARVKAILANEEWTPLKTRNTLWGLYNAVVRDEDFRSTRETKPDARLRRIWLGPGSKIKLAALKSSQELVNQQAANSRP